ncbi:hybrid sensor histidine kinase/response regulator, partial [cyanobacterium TDX16]
NYTSFVAEELERATDEPGGDRWRPVLDDVKQVRAASDRATSLTHQLLAFGRREVVQPRVLDLNDVVSGVEQILRRTLGEHVELVVRRASGPVRATADAGQLEQVLMNLAVNARDAMPRGGTLTIETSVVDGGDDAGHTDRWASLRVQDTGEGMPPEVQDRAFEPFFTTKPRGEGSGLGLATVYGIVTQAGGIATITSGTGDGTTVTVRLPATDAEPTTEVASPGAAPNHGGETILVVEDETAIREVTRRILTRNGHTVLTASGGAEAVSMADEHEDPIHLLLTDVVMPQMQGNEVAERVAAVRPGIRVLYMSGYAHSVLAEQGTLAEGVHLVQKPFSEGELMAEVREVLDGA